MTQGAMLKLTHNMEIVGIEYSINGQGRKFGLSTYQGHSKDLNFVSINFFSIDKKINESLHSTSTSHKRNAVDVPDL